MESKLYYNVSDLYVLFDKYKYVRCQHVQFVRDLTEACYVLHAQPMYHLTSFLSAWLSLPV